MNVTFSIAVNRPPGEMPSIDPSEIETDETMNAIITHSETGKLTVTRREPKIPAHPLSDEPSPIDPRPAERG